MFANLWVSQLVVVAFAGVLVAVAIGDIRRLTIPNRYCAAIVLLYPIYVATATYAVDWVDGAIVGAVAVIIGFLLYAMRLAGGGDVKFFSAVALWAGSPLLVEFVFVTALVGGVVATAMLIHRRLTRPRAAPAGMGLAARATASVNVFLGGLLLARSGAAASTPSGAAEAPSLTDSERVPPVGTLPYGAAISVGGIVVAAMLLMKG
jgi:prepilin peptidase CpaA